MHHWYMSIIKGTELPMPQSFFKSVSLEKSEHDTL